MAKRTTAARGSQPPPASAVVTPGTATAAAAARAAPAPSGGPLPFGMSVRTSAIRRLAVAATLLASAGAALPAAVLAQDEPWRLVPLPQASLVLARDGSLVGEIGRERRVSVPLRSLPRFVPQAFLAVEDKRFYQHDGVDLIGVAAAVKDAALTGEIRGASTITQLVVGNMHPEIIDRSDRSPGRKLREQQAAREMEKRYTKEQILEAFLNLIDFGHGWKGV